MKEQSRSHRVLLIEDDRADAELLKELLSQKKAHSFSVQWTDRLQKGLEILTQGNIDVVLLDLSLPDSHGLETASRIRQQFPSLPIVVLTGLDDESFALEVVRKGAQDYLVKGKVDADVLSRVMRYAIQRQRTEEALRESEERSRLIIETANDAFVGMNQVGLITDWNTQAEALLGWSREEIFGRSFVETLLIPSAREFFEGGIRDFLKTGENSLLNKRMEVSVLRRDGQAFSAELTLWPIRAQGVYRFNAFIHDITERKRIDKMKEEFIGTVSHELRNPLTIIKEGLLLIADEVPGSINAEQKDLLKTVRMNLDQLMELINNLLDLSKMQAGCLTLVRRPTDLRTLVEGVLKRYQLIAGKRTLEAQCESIPLVLCDPDRINQVLSNLMGNAIKFTGQEGTIRVTAKEGAGGVEISVQDTGVGISSEDLAKLFKRFSQVGKREEQHRGTGLGLALCKELVELHGGMISVDSTFGKGTRFTFTLPASQIILALEAGFNELIQKAPGGKSQVSVGMVGIALQGSSNLKTVEEWVRAQVDPQDVVLCLEPYGIFCLSLTDASGIRRLTEQLRMRTQSIPGTLANALYPMDAPDIHTLFAKVRQALEGDLSPHPLRKVA